MKTTAIAGNEDHEESPPPRGIISRSFSLSLWWIEWIVVVGGSSALWRKSKIKIVKKEKMLCILKNVVWIVADHKNPKWGWFVHCVGNDMRLRSLRSLWPDPPEETSLLPGPLQSHPPEEQGGSG